MLLVYLVTTSGRDSDLRQGADEVRKKMKLVLVEDMDTHLAATVTERRRQLHDYDFAVCLTHDIDQVTLGWLESAWFELRQIKRLPRSLYNIAGLMWGKARGRDPCLAGGNAGAPRC